MTCLNHNSDMTYSYVWHETLWVCHASFIFVAWPLFVSRATPGCSRAAEKICLIWLIPMCDINWFTCETWLMHCVCGMPYSDVWHDSIICVTCLIHVCGMLWSYVWHYSFRSVTSLIHQVTCSWRWHLSDWWEKYRAKACFCWLVRDKTPPSRLLRTATLHLYNWKACRI